MKHGQFTETLATVLFILLVMFPVISFAGPIVSWGQQRFDSRDFENVQFKEAKK